MFYLLMFFAGALCCNAIPHVVSGLLGQRFYTPWARPRGTGMSSPVENFLWGAANLLAGLLILDAIWPQDLPRGLAVFAAGFVVLGTAMSLLFGKRIAARDA